MNKKIDDDTSEGEIERDARGGKATQAGKTSKQRKAAELGGAGRATSEADRSDAPLFGQYRVRIHEVEDDAGRLGLEVMESRDPREIGRRFAARVIGGLEPLRAKSLIPDLVDTLLWVDVREAEGQYEVEIPETRRR